MIVCCMYLCVVYAYEGVCICAGCVMCNCCVLCVFVCGVYMKVCYRVAVCVCICVVWMCILCSVWYVYMCVVYMYRWVFCV